MKEWNTVYRDMLLALNTMSESIASAKTLFERDARAFDEIKEDGNNWKARAERAEARVAELEAQPAAAQPAIEAWAQYQADNERQEKLQEEMIAEGLIKRPFWQ